MNACESGNSGVSDVIAESDWASEEGFSANEELDSEGATSGGSDSDSADESDNSSGGSSLDSGNNNSTGDATTTASNNNSSGDTTTAPSNNNSSGDTATAPTNNNSSGDTTTAPSNNNSSGDTTTAPSNNNSSGDTTTAPSNNNSSGDTTTATSDNSPTTTSSNNSDSSNNSSEPEVSAASSSNMLPFTSFKAPAVDLPSKPKLRRETKIPAAGLVVKRVSDFLEFATGKMPHFNASDDSQLNHAYARHHPFSKDNTYILGNGGWRWRALWKADGTYLREITQAGSGHAVWANTENDYIYLIDTDSQKSFAKTNVLTDKKTVLRTFPYGITMGQSEGDISDDDNRVAFSSNNNGKVRVTAYDIKNNTYTERTLSRSFSELDWLSVSRSGEYILVAYHKGSRDVELYNWDLSFVRRITNQKHGDIGWDENGDECWFAIGHLEPSLSRTTIGKWRLSDNAYTEVLGGPNRFTNRPDSLSGHISARASDKVPGTIFVSLLDAEGPYTLFSLKTDGSERIQFFGWHGSELKNYYDEPHFASNRTGDVGVYKSNWGNSDDPTEMYLVYKDPDS